MIFLFFREIKKKNSFTDVGHEFCRDFGNLECAEFNGQHRLKNFRDFFFNFSGFGFISGIFQTLFGFFRVLTDFFEDLTDL